MKPSEWEKCPDLTTRDSARWSGPLQVHPGPDGPTTAGQRPNAAPDQLAHPRR